MEVAFGGWVAAWPWHPKDAGVLLHHHEPWPADVVPDGEWQVNTWTDFVAARDAYRAIAPRLCLSKYEPLSAGMGMRVRYVLRQMKSQGAAAGQ